MIYAVRRMQMALPLLVPCLLVLCRSWVDEGKRGHNRDLWGSEGPLVDGAVAIMLARKRLLSVIVDRDPLHLY